MSDDDNTPLTAEWEAEEFGDEEASLFAIEGTEDGTECWHNWHVRVELPAGYQVTRGVARKIVELLRSTQP